MDCPNCKMPTTTTCVDSKHMENECFEHCVHCKWEEGDSHDHKENCVDCEEVKGDG